MKKSVWVFGAALLLAGGAFAQKDTVYISPNNDGVQDVLEIPLQIKERRYVKEWSLIVENENGETVRKIGNKDKRPTRITFLSFWKALFTPKRGVDIPSMVSWNGLMDNSEVAPDGKYFYYFTAADDNGNSARTEKLCVIVDNTAPEINVQQPSQDGKIFGEGAKIAFVVNQNGSEEDEWTGSFVDSDGNVVRTYKWTKSEPLKFEWTGTDDNGAPLPDGVYSYKISAKDRAGNVSSPAGISNIIYSAEKPVTNITLNGSRYFSPNGNGVNESVEFEVKIPEPDAKSGNRIVDWAVKIVDESGKVCRTFAGKDNPPSKIVFDGKNDSKADCPEGQYQAVVSAKYLNGYEPDVIKSPVIVLDKTAPSAKVRASSSTFSPDGDGNLDELVITQDFAAMGGAPVDSWKGKIVNENGEVVREYDFGAYPPEKLVWDGLDSRSTLAADGKYNYILSATDLAGNSTEIKLDAVTLDTSKTELLLAVSPDAFNPASGDKNKSSVKMTPVVKSGSSISSYNIEVKGSDGKTVWTQEGTSLPKSISWSGLASDGKRCADGKYVATLSTKSTNGAEAKISTQPFVIDTVAPEIEVSAPYVLFSPDGDGNKDSVKFAVKSSDEESWNAAVYNSKNQVVRTFSWKGKVPANIEWNGTDASGNKVADGSYKIVFSSEDAAGNKGNTEIAGITVDSREAKAYVTADSDAFSPNGDGYLETQKFTIRTTLSEGIEDWSFTISTPEGKVVKQWGSADQKTLPAEITWNGAGNDNKIVEGAFSANLKISYAKGNSVDVKSSAFICSVTPPNIAVQTAPQYFSPDNDGENDDLFIKLSCNDVVPIKNWSLQINDPQNGKPFWKTSGKSSITERLIWDGRGNNGELVQSAMDYPYVFTVTDTLGMTSTFEGLISVDILVIRVGDVLKMAVPSIIFRQDEADFGVQVVDANGNVTKPGITPAQAKNNERVLKRVAQVLNKFKNYTVTVEGHANSVTGLEDEETTNKYGKALEPLSKARAEFVKGQLKSYGVDANRLTAVGRGGRQPVAARGDKDNAWKNRRVEFILNK